MTLPLIGSKPLMINNIKESLFLFCWLLLIFYWSVLIFFYSDLEHVFLLLFYHSQGAVRLKILGTFSITFTANGEPEEFTWPPLCHQVCSLWFGFRREEGAPAINYIREGFLAALRNELTFDSFCNNFLPFMDSNVVFCDWKTMYFAWSKTKKTSGERSWKQNGGSKFLNMCMQRSTVMEFCINVCLLLFLENAF